VPLSEQIVIDIEGMKAKMATGSNPDDYTPSTLASALEAGTVDLSKLSATFGDFNPEAKKMLLKAAKESNDMAAKIGAPEAELDWASWEEKLTDVSAIAKVKAICDEAAVAVEAELEKDTTAADAMKQIDAAYKGAGGFIEQASGEEKAAEAGMLQSVADLEALTVEIDGVSQITVGEILEREPELRAEIEEEIKNNVWAP